jgi:HK97 gp10 family phage protein
MSFRLRLVPGWASGLGPHVEKMIDRVGDDVRDDARRLAPVLTGSLSKSIEANGEGNGTKRVVQIGVNEDYFGPGGEHPADYGLFVEDGTAIQAAQPYLRPALYQNRSVK